MGTVIKAGEATRILQRLTTVDLADHVAEAKALLQRARSEAHQLLETAKQDSLRLRVEAERRGFEEGSAKGYEKGFADGNEAGRDAGLQSAHDEAMARYNEQCAALAAMLTRLVEDFGTRKEELLVAAERHLLEFAVKLASKLTFAIGTLDRESVVANVDRAVRLVGLRTDLTIRAHPTDLAVVEAFAGEVLQQTEASRAVKIVPDDSVAPGGCRLQTDAVVVDATLETQIEEIVGILLGSRAERA